uniref:Methanolan biosynthesis EpsI domain-containing protein n=1 Tax=Solibacter usitatus (strain Ellin6076) TaxID=234267 RepID=Q02BV1_SOLUE
MRFLGSKYAGGLTALLLIQGVVFYAVALRAENTPPVSPLSAFPANASGWEMYKDVKIEQETLDILKADDTLNRIYVNPERTSQVFLFIAFFKSQRYGQAPHSPKNCLPGSGFEPIESGPISIAVPDRPEPIVVNRYLTARGDEKSVTLYWYQSRNRIIAGEFSAKFWLIADSIRYHRSDSSLVKVVVPVRDNDSAAATRIATNFVKAIFQPVSRQLPL